MAPDLTYESFLRSRGFDPRNVPSFLWRMFVVCWAEPGFHRFWRLWNPLYGYALFRVYLAIGGNKRPALASLVVFLLCGFVLHDLLRFVTAHQLSLSSTIAFFVYWLLALLSRRFGAALKQETWPGGINVVMNLACVAFGLACGAALAPVIVR